MKIFVTDKYRIITFAFICMLIGTVTAGMHNKAVTTMSEQRLLPIYCVDRADNAVSVTFDCAWGADDIETILSILEKNDCKATFFVLGTWAEKYPDKIKKIAENGHEIGNHSYNHTYYTHLSGEDILADMKKCTKILKKITGTSPVLFRAPAGDYNNEVMRVCDDAGVKYLQWDVDSLDWKGLGCEEMSERVLNKTKSGSIILFHNDTAHTADSLDFILKGLKQKGFHFVKGSELIYKDNYMIDYAGKQIKK